MIFLFVNILKAGDGLDYGLRRRRGRSEEKEERG
jgi:hypothetical protein